MKRYLIVKMSSMGDVIHTLPALTDAQKALGDIQFDWVVEPGFAEIPYWHHAVNKVIEAPLRHFRKAPWETYQQGQWHTFIQKLRYTTYDGVIDAQGLIKSALVTKFAKGPKCGLDKQSAREGFASLIYDKKINVPKGQHAVERVRQLFAKALQYSIADYPVDYGIDKSKLIPYTRGDNTIIFLHGTTWSTKHWPEQYWCRLAQLFSAKGFQILLPWGSESEQLRAERIRDFCQQKGTALLPEVLPKLKLGEITSLIAKAKGIIAVDTGLGHIAAAMAVPTISLYGPTDPGLTGAYGPKQYHLKVDAPCAPCFGRDCKKGNDFAVMPPCFETLPPEKVFHSLIESMADPQLHINGLTIKNNHANKEKVI